MLIDQSNEELVMRKEVIITDWDGILQEIEFRWVSAFRDLYDSVYSDFFSYEHLEDLTVKSVFERPEYFLTKWLGKPERLPLNETEYALFEYPYTEDTFFYHKCPMLIMFDALVKMAQEDFCESITILTQTQFEGGDPRKEFIFNNFIKPLSDKFRLIQIPLEKPKWEYIKENDMYFTVFIDDRGDIIRDVAEKVSMRNKQFIMPNVGYNYFLRSDYDFIAKLQMHNSNLTVYDQKILPFTPEMSFKADMDDIE